MRRGAKFGWFVVALVAAMPALSPTNPAHAMTSSTAPSVPGTQCTVFATTNVWNTPITSLPVNAHSAQWLASMDAATSDLHPDFGPSGTPGQPYGIPWNVVGNATTFTTITFDDASESDPGPYPLTAGTRIEGGSDRHAIMVDPTASAHFPACSLFETWDTTFRSGGHSTAGSGAIWNLSSNHLRPAGWTSADAAGLPILAGLVNYDQVASGTMDHAIRFTASCTQKSYLWPARHEAGQSTTKCPPMGARFRLKSSFRLPSSQCSAFCQTVIRTMKTYGLILADNGSNWFFQGTADTRWTDTQVDQLKAIPASQFVAVNESCLEINVNSAQARQPGTVDFTSHCG